MATATEPTAEEMRAAWHALADGMGWSAAHVFRRDVSSERWFCWLRDGVVYARMNGAAERCPKELAAVEELLTRA